MSVQENYNQIIYDSCDEETLLNLSHLRSNVFAPVNVNTDDEVLLLIDGEAALFEHFKALAKKVVFHAEDSGESPDKDNKYSLIIMTKMLRLTPLQLKERLIAGGMVAFASDNGVFNGSVAANLFKEAGFSQVDKYIAKPDYEFATELILEGYKEEESEGYLILAKN